MTAISKASHNRGILLILLTVLIWGTSFSVLKYFLRYFPPAVIVATRFAIAAVPFVGWLRQLNLRLLGAGVLLGCLCFMATSLTVLGLETISANRSAFILSLNAILVPLLGIFLCQQLPAKILVAAGLAISGIGLLSWEGGGLSWGDALTFMAALSFAIYILTLAKLTPRYPTLPLVAVQLWIMALIGIIWAMPHFAVYVRDITAGFGTFLYLGLIVTATPVWTQTMAGRWVPAHEVALLYTLEPVFATFFSFLFLGEQLGVRGIIGAALVVTATVVSQSDR
ncbi:DMT family transporter [Aliterella atlantica]|uniref:DMT family transporter n=1 Tax=Aliterella atlantica TaxID=1827278 RepID=UPI0005D39C72|nr:DMT family transporter [Aliterella atlantica]